MSGAASEPELHLPPANLKDFTPETRKIWSDWMDLAIDVQIYPSKYIEKTVILEDGTPKWKPEYPDLLRLDPKSELAQNWVKDNRPDLTRFYDRSKPKNRPAKPGPAADFPIWSAFPMTVTYGAFNAQDRDGKPQPVILPIKGIGGWKDPNSGDGKNYYWQADQFRIYQDEYLEWAVVRNEEGKITKITFSCEGPEYWEKLAQYQPDDLLRLYNEFNPGCNVTKADLFNEDGTYNRYNKYNSLRAENGAIAHLIHPASTLGAEVDIVAQATVGRAGCDPIADPKGFCQCANFGDKYRNSDPHIGSIACHAAVKSNLSISVHEPIGLYMRSFADEKLQPPEGHEGFKVRDCWNPIRGDDDDEDAKVRVEFKVPDGAGFVVGDLIDTRTNCTVNYGSQVAHHISIGVKVDGGAPPAESGKPNELDSCNKNRYEDFVDNPGDEYEVDESCFLHLMQYKVQVYGDEGFEPWKTWRDEFAVLTKFNLADGGTKDGKIEKPIKISPDAAAASNR